MFTIDLLSHGAKSQKSPRDTGLNQLGSAGMNRDSVYLDRGWILSMPIVFHQSVKRIKILKFFGNFVKKDKTFVRWNVQCNKYTNFEDYVSINGLGKNGFDPLLAQVKMTWWVFRCIWVASYPFLTWFNGTTVEVWGWIINLMLYFNVYATTYSCLDYNQSVA